MKRDKNFTWRRVVAVSYLSGLVIVREIGPHLGKNRPAARMKTRVFIMGFPGTGQAGKLDDLWPLGGAHEHGGR